MQAWETSRKAQVEKKQEEEAKAIDPAAAAFPEQTGSLFQPKREILKYDAETEKLKQSLESAQELKNQTDSQKTGQIAPGPLMPDLKYKLETPEDLRLISQAYLIYAEACYDVYLSLHSYGLKKNVDGIKQIQLVSDEWKLYFSEVKINSLNPLMKEADIRTFFEQLGQGEAILDKAIQGINTFIDRQRTRTYVP